jgi:hypothetical protein
MLVTGRTACCALQLDRGYVAAAPRTRDRRYRILTCRELPAQGQRSEPSTLVVWLARPAESGTLPAGPAEPSPVTATTGATQAPQLGAKQLAFKVLSHVLVCSNRHIHGRKPACSHWSIVVDEGHANRLQILFVLVGEGASSLCHRLADVDAKPNCRQPCQNPLHLMHALECATWLQDQFVSSR